MQDLQRFWVVWRLDGRTPTKQHVSYKAAHDEAIRLAENNPEIDFWVLEAKRLVRAKRLYTIEEYDIR